MEALSLYLFKSSVWLFCFAITYMVFLRNERYFTINRMYLILGVLASLLGPLTTIRYKVTVPTMPTEIAAEMPIPTAIQNSGDLDYTTVLTWLALTGMAFFLIRLLTQTAKMIHIISNSKAIKINQLKVIRTDAFPASFSFFSYVFLNPSTTETEEREILNHEAEHIEQYHFIDLILVELMCLILWFNPLAWLFSRYIRQNHEYLADQKAIERTGNAAVYKAVLLNHLLGGDALRLGHSFNYSLNKKRFTMMSHKPTSKFARLKPLLVIPMLATVMFAFAKPTYQHQSMSPQTNEPNPQSKNQIVVQAKDGKTTISSGDSITIKSNLQKENPLIICDGKEISYEAMQKIAPNDIESINVLKGDAALALYPEKGENGVIVITMKNAKAEEAENPTFFIVEKMPVFPGGEEALREFIANNLVYPAEAAKQAIQGRVFVTFIVSKTGLVEKIKIAKSVNPLLDEAAMEVVRKMPQWTPGTQKGEAVDVHYTIPIQFSLK